METKETYQLFSRFYDAYTKGFADDIPLYLNLCKDRRNILEIGCGTGRILKAIVKAGKVITGVDISDEMLAIASQKLDRELKAGKLKILNFNFQNNFLPEKYDIVFITWYTFNYIIEDTMQFLQNIKSSMRPGSLLVLDLFYPKTLSDPSLGNKWIQRELFFNGQTILLEDKRSVKDNLETRVQRYHYNNKIHEIITKRRYYPSEEISKILTESGFKNEIFIEDYNLLKKVNRPAKGYVCIAEI